MDFAGQDSYATAVINVRRLAALDLLFLGPKLIIAEFAVGVIGPLALGALTLSKAHSVRMTVFGAYLISLGFNYVPLLLHAISIVRQDSAQSEIEQESVSQAEMFRKYRRQSLWLLVPIVVPVVAAKQQLHSRQPRNRGLGAGA